MFCDCFCLVTFHMTFLLRDTFVLCMISFDTWHFVTISWLNIMYLHQICFYVSLDDIWFYLFKQVPRKCLIKPTQKQLLHPGWTYIQVKPVSASLHCLQCGVNLPQQLCFPAPCGLSASASLITNFWLDSSLLSASLLLYYSCKQSMNTFAPSFLHCENASLRKKT